MSSFEQDGVRIASVAACIGLIVLIGLFARSTVQRSRYINDAETLLVTVSKEPHMGRRRIKEYQLVLKNTNGEESYFVMPGMSLFHDHEAGDSIEVLALPGTFYVQPKDSTEYWMMRFEVNVVLGLLTLLIIAVLLGGVQRVQHLRSH